jgi:hypothetical protein
MKSHLVIAAVWAGILLSGIFGDAGSGLAWINCLFAGAVFATTPLPGGEKVRRQLRRFCLR